MRRIGFSTGALALGDFPRALEMLRGKAAEIVELSALRQPELPVLLRALDHLNVTQFSYVAIHAPSKIEPGSERETVESLGTVSDRGWPIVIHPDAITDFDLWRRFGNLLLVENNDKRKTVGRTASELRAVLKRIPDAGLCLDLGHSRQVDPTMSEAALILREFKGRIRQLHLSEVNSQSRHDPLTVSAIIAFNKVSHLIPDEVPIVLETPVARAEEIDAEIECAREALPPQNTLVAMAI
jgi:hypothetical protein